MEATNPLAPSQPVAVDPNAGAVAVANPSSAPADGAVDLNVHPSGIVPQLQ